MRTRNFQRYIFKDFFQINVPVDIREKISTLVTLANCRVLIGTKRISALINLIITILLDLFKSVIPQKNISIM